ncbi:MAG: YciI family protein [Alphaproteobacteria bacterium]|jgi:uncharacterized protein|nr:YciI family protein [Alphaproteobacteria bacterium]MBT4710408.1 YciI family protein [Alphaproteobacteria bacterium]MBT5860689.1 YciI family protein [Alphaproteobacteria bacterium]
MLYVITAIDRPGQPETRAGARPDHLAHIAENAGSIRIAGAFLTEKDEPSGSMIVIEADSLADAEGFMAKDPYVAAGVFESITIRRWRVVAGTGLEAKAL